MKRIQVSLLLLIPLDLSQSFVVCPYCDPNFVASPNLEEAMRGYDVPMGNPDPGQGRSDPGIRNQIFSPMIRNQDGLYELDGTFVTANPQVKASSWNRMNSLALALNSVLRF